MRRFLLLLALAGTSTGTPAGDGIRLQVGHGATAQEVALSWTGNQPLFEVRRASQASAIADPANLQAETANRAWTDLPPGSLAFYLVSRKPDPAATIVAGTSDRFLLSGTVLTPAGPIEGQVLVEGNLITCVAASCAAQPGASGATTIATNGILLPGLIDSHNHGLFDVFDASDWTPQQVYMNHNQWPTEVRYGQVVDAKQYLNGEGGSPINDTCELNKYGEIKALIAGTTSRVLAAPGVSCYASLIRTIDVAQNDLGADRIQVATLLPGDNAAAQTICNNFASGSTNAYLVHVGEGTDTTARNEFATLSNRAAGCLLAPQTAIVHGTAFEAADFATMASHGMKLVWSPKSNIFLYGATTRIDLARQAGIKIALAPDWSLGGSQNLLDEIRVAHAVDHAQFGDILTPQDLFKMVTIDAASVLGLEGVLGSLEVGKRADITVIGGYRPAPYDALLLATPLSVRLAMVDGRALYGDAQLVAAGPSTPGCESLPLCGTSKFLCAAETSTLNKLNQTYEQFRQILVNDLTSYDQMIGPMGIASFSPIAPILQCP